MQKKQQAEKRVARNKTRLFWADAMRVIAIFMVVIIHTSATVIYAWNLIPSVQWQFANILNSFSRMSVPLFVMLSGAFLLSKKTESLPAFLQKRIPRILLPWFFWGTLQFLYTYNFSVSEVLGPNLFQRIAATYFGGFWFMPMIFGLYLLTPIIKPFIQKMKTKEFLYIFFLWLTTASIIPTLNQIGGINISLQLPIWIQYTGYFVAGYYFVNHVRVEEKKYWQVVLLMVVSCLLIAMGTYWKTVSNNSVFEAFYSYTNLFVVTASLSGFFVLKKQLSQIKIRKKLQEKIAKLSTASFGIFLSHALLLQIFAHGVFGFKIHSLSVAPVLAIPIVSLLIFFTSAGIVIVLQKYIPKWVS